MAEHKPTKDRHGTRGAVCRLCGQIWPCEVARLEAKNLEMAAALREIEPHLAKEWEQLMNCRQRPAANETGILLDHLRAAISGEGKVWEQVMDMANYLVHRRGCTQRRRGSCGRCQSLQYPAEVAARALAAMKGE